MKLKVVFAVSILLFINIPVKGFAGQGQQTTDSKSMDSGSIVYTETKADLVAGSSVPDRRFVAKKGEQEKIPDSLQTKSEVQNSITSPNSIETIRLQYKLSKLQDQISDARIQKIVSLLITLTATSSAIGMGVSASYANSESSQRKAYIAGTVITGIFDLVGMGFLIDAVIDEKYYLRQQQKEEKKLWFEEAQGEIKGEKETVLEKDRPKAPELIPKKSDGSYMPSKIPVI